MRLRLSRLLAVPLALVGPLALSHINIVDRGIHFKGGRPDFGQPPLRYSLYYFSDMQDFYASWRPGTDYVGWPDYPGEEEEGRQRKRERNGLHLYRVARDLETRGRLQDALRVYRSSMRRGLGNRATLRGRIELLKAAQGQVTAGLPELLAAFPSTQTNLLRPVPAEVAPALRSFRAYAEAARLATAGKTREGAEMLYRAASEDPRRSWSDACLITCVRYLLSEGKTVPTESDLRLADASLRLLLTATPHSRFVPAAHSWLGRIDFLQGRMDRAIRHYRVAMREPDECLRAMESIALCYRKIGRTADAAAWYLRRAGAADRTQKARTTMDFKRVAETFRGEDSRRFTRLLKEDPALLAAYTDYRLDFSRPSNDLLALGKFALQPGASAHAQARLGEAALALRHPDLARSLAQAAWQGNGSSDDRALATFVLGTLEMRQGRYAAARSKYREIVREFPNSYLVSGAKENLAIFAERAGDLGEALTLYDDLGYQQDFAYLADARMTPRQLAAYVRQPDARKRSLLVYTLGMRYLRLGRWDDAERTFARLSTWQRRQLTIPKSQWDIRWILDQGGLQDPKATLIALRHLDRLVHRARGAERKAQAKLNLANYYYTHRDLLLYSPALWNGTRTESVAYSWNASVATRQDDAALARHHREHECLAHTVRLCQEILRDYPKTKVAPHAAYRAGCAVERLAHMAPYWRWQDDNQDLVGHAVAFFHRAEATREPELRRRAKKYAKVFRAESAENRQAFSMESAPVRRWDPWK